MSKHESAGKLPGWTLIIALIGLTSALLIVWACRDLEMSWWLGGPAVIVVVVVGTIAERRIERAYLSPLRGH
jgi:hypothetical protein